MKPCCSQEEFSKMVGDFEMDFNPIEMLEISIGWCFEEINYIAQKTYGKHTSEETILDQAKNGDSPDDMYHQLCCLYRDMCATYFGATDFVDKLAMVLGEET